MRAITPLCAWRDDALLRKRMSISFFCSIISSAAFSATSFAFLPAGPRRIFGFLASGSGSSRSSPEIASCRSFCFLRRDLMFRTPARIASLTAPSLYRAFVCGREKESV